jgi:hypothetical protein
MTVEQVKTVFGKTWRISDDPNKHNFEDRESALQWIKDRDALKAQTPSRDGLTFAQLCERYFKECEHDEASEFSDWDGDIYLDVVLDPTLNAIFATPILTQEDAQAAFAFIRHDKDLDTGPVIWALEDYLIRRDAHEA